jgi:hypothetical protein
MLRTTVTAAIFLAAGLAACGNQAELDASIYLVHVQPS